MAGVLIIGEESFRTRLCVQLTAAPRVSTCSHREAKTELAIFEPDTVLVRISESRPNEIEVLARLAACRGSFSITAIIQSEKSGSHLQTRAAALANRCMVNPGMDEIVASVVTGRQRAPRL